MQIIAFERELKGTGASRRLRRAGRTPGIVYGNGKPMSIEVDHNSLYHALKKEVFHSSILDLELSGNHQQVLLRDVQYHPFKQLVLHVDFLRIDAKQELQTYVPLHFINQESAPAVKLGGAIINHIVNDIEISCLPANLPKFIEVDLSKLELNQTLHAKDIVLPEGVKLTLHVEQENPVIITATMPDELKADDASSTENPST